MKRRTVNILSVMGLSVIVSNCGGRAYPVRFPCELEFLLAEESSCTGCPPSAREPFSPSPPREPARADSERPQNGKSALRAIRRGVALLRFAACMIETFAVELTREIFIGREKS